MSSSLSVRAEAGEAPRLIQHAYVWQRAWTPAVARSVRDHAGAFDGLEILAAEISAANDVIQVASPQPDWRSLAASRCPIGLVVRIGAYRGSFAPDASLTRALLDRCDRVLSQARADGVEPAELQLDFDAGVGQLASYRQWVRDVRRAHPGTRLAITALPAWLAQDDFPALVRECDLFVLQVHSLEKPAGRATPVSLCDAGRAAQWIEQAAQVGAPFRVALPTYGYGLAFDASGRFLGLQAEGPTRRWPEGSQVQKLFPDAAALAGLVRRLGKNPPAHCAGLVWFRLPSGDDALAWPWPTLAAVMHGVVPQDELVLRADAAEPGALDLQLCNAGASAAHPVAFRLRWNDSRLVAADTMTGWMLERRGSNEVLLRPRAETVDETVSPGEQRTIGWLRLQPATSVEVTVVR